MTQTPVDAASVRTPDTNKLKAIGMRLQAPEFTNYERDRLAELR